MTKPSRISSIMVHVDDSYGIEKSLRKFKRLCESFGVVKEYRKRQDYKKPSVRQKEKLEAAVKRRHKTNVRPGRPSPSSF